MSNSKALVPVAANRTAQGRFEKGASGNPGGRPKSAKELREMAQKYGPKAVRFLYECMASDKVKDTVRVTAAIALLDRGYGKPAQAITGGDEDDRPVGLSVKHKLDFDNVRAIRKMIDEENERDEFDHV
jgi:hypothetical protein